MADDERFVRVSTADNQADADAQYAVLDDAGIKVIVLPRVDLPSVGQGWLELQVHEADLARASELLEQVEPDAGEGEAAAIAAFEANHPEAAPKPPLTDPPPPASVRFAGKMHLLLLAFSMGDALLGRYSPHVLDQSGRPYHSGVSSWALVFVGQIFTALIGYALAFGPSEQRFWQRVRALAVLRLVVAMLLTGADIKGGDQAAALQLAVEAAVLAALTMNLGLAVRRVLVGVGVVAWCVFAGITVGYLELNRGDDAPQAPSEAASEVQKRVLTAAESAVASGWWNFQTMEKLSLCEDGRWVLQRKSPPDRTGTWKAQGTASAGSISFHEPGGADFTRRYDVLSKSGACPPPGCDLALDGVRWGRDVNAELCEQPAE